MTQELSRDSIRFPSSGHIWVPRSGGRAAAAGMSMYSPCALPAVFAQRALYVAVRVLGPRIMPGRRDAWSDPIESEVWEAFVDEWHAAFGAWDSMALYRRPQRGRTGCAILLLREGRGVGFVRITTDRERASNEFAVMSGVHAARPATFRIARPVGWGSMDGWSWIGTESVPNYPLGAVRRESVRLKVIDELAGILDDVLPRASSVPRGWRGSHGDFSPWNLRTEIGGAVRVIDWEDAGFAPPGIDALYGGLTAHLTFGTALPRSTNQEAVEWIGRVLMSRRADDEDANELNSRLIELLRTVPAA